MTEETKYVLRHEWVEENGKVREKFNKNELKYNERFNQLENKIEKQTDLAERSLESQERQEKNQEKLNKTMEKFGDEFVEMKYQVKGHEEKLASVQGVLEEKQKGNVQIIGYIIGGVVSVIVAAIGAAQWIFN